MIFSSRGKKEQALPCFQNDVRAELTELKQRMNEAYARLDYTTDPMLIDSCIYEINATSLRYEYLLGQLKKL
ncbi:Protein of unknown function [Lachnospiraceae bacterium XBB1006]|nr:Protein of unknown function [Lachnospiraceae bacterium XBB1006]